MHQHPANKKLHDNPDFGARAADAVTAFMGSWTFIILQTVVIIGWVTLNVIGGIRHWDPYTFTLLNLLFSIQAAYASPLILLAQNRQTQHDRLSAEEDYRTNHLTLTEVQTIRSTLTRLLESTPRA